MIDDNEKTPQSNNVAVFSTGECRWYPLYDHSVTQCPVDVTWFPFDEQKCELVFESWFLFTSELGLYVLEENLQSFQTSNEWHLVGTRVADITLL